MTLKVMIRERIPARYQVPLKFWFNWLGGSHEPELKLLRYLVDKGDQVIDVGGNRGTYAYDLHRLGAVVDVFEPNSNCVSVLNAWCSRIDAVTIHPFALSNVEGEATLHIPVDGSGLEHDASASLEQRKFESVHDQSVRLRTLDGFGFKGVKFIKIDVEGHESNVLEGALACIAAMHPSLLVEIEQRHISQPIDTVFKRIIGLGYAGYFLRRGKLSAIDTFNAAKDQDFEKSSLGHQDYINNFLFVHPLGMNEKFRTLLAKTGLPL